MCEQYSITMVYWKKGGKSMPLHIKQIMTITKVKTEEKKKRGTLTNGNKFSYVLNEWFGGEMNVLE